ncbi:MAG: hypothetical protein OEY96_03415 [Gammaproteobacteria bacterium]|nr:hypothetical protein [Gammaproteobacteria bacterium]
MALQAQTKLIRKQFLISESNAKKLERLASSRGSSAAEVVRLAIEAYEPDGESMDLPELMDLVSGKLKAAIASTQNANVKISNTLQMLDDKKGTH